MEAHSTGLNNLDFVVLGILLLSGIMAMFRGFVREVLALASWMIAYFAAVHYHKLAEPFVHHHIKNETGATWVAGVGIFLITILICGIASHIIAGLVRGKALNAIDRSLGFGFGLLRGALVVCMVYLALSTFMWSETANADDPQAKDAAKPPEWVEQAKTRPWLMRGAVVLKTFIPEKDMKSVKVGFDQHKGDAQKIIDQQALDMLSTPTPKEKPGAGASYDESNRDKLNTLINKNEKSTP